MSTSTTLHAGNEDGRIKIALIGSGTIGLSFAALHLSTNPNAHITIYDTRPDLETYIAQNLPNYLSTTPELAKTYRFRLTLASSLSDAVLKATIIQEQGPENLPFKKSLWANIEPHAPKDALLWSSTSGIPASAQSADMRDPSRLLVVHPYNPPHIMPLLEVVPSPSTSQDLIDRTLEYWRGIGRTPIVIRKEVTGFVANRLAFALFREAISLVNDGVISVEDLDKVVESSMGPRWAVAGPFKSYHAGGGEGGLAAFMKNIGGTVKECWAAGEEIKVGPGGKEEGWVEGICEQAQEAYGVVDTKERDRVTRDVLAAIRGGTKIKDINQEV